MSYKVVKDIKVWREMMPSGHLMPGDRLPCVLGIHTDAADLSWDRKMKDNTEAGLEE